MQEVRSRYKSGRDSNSSATTSQLGAWHGQDHIQLHLWRRLRSGGRDARSKLVAVYAARRFRHHLWNPRADLSRSNDTVAGTAVLRLYAGRRHLRNYFGGAGDPPQGGPLGIADI